MEPAFQGFEAYRFPTKAQMKYNISQENQIKVISNHFSVIPDEKDFTFVEWHMTFIEKDQLNEKQEIP